MPKADKPPIPNPAPLSTKSDSSPRRSFLGHLAGLGAAAVIVHAGTGGARAAGPDDELIALCEEFRALERRFIAAHDDIKDDDERDIFIAPITEAQRPLLERILRLRATTQAGFMARARMLGLYEPEWIKPKNITRAGASNNERMAGALVRDMIAGDVA